jgi:alpha-beta hydrolase superfamily lysophospholipase
MALSKNTIFVRTAIIVEAVLKVLRSRYSKFVLWGRSMGAVSALLYTIAYNNPEDIILLVLDSPFSSFEVITKELAMRKVKVP